MQQEPIVLFRKSLESEGEFDVCKKYLTTVEYRSQVPPNSLVIPRYSCLPFYQELEAELALIGSKLINSYSQHSWIADVMQWAGPGGLLEGKTPRTWDNWSRLPFKTSYVVKGRTNSRKHQWSTHMFAPDWSHVPSIARKLLDDTFIGQQGLVVREFVPLKQLGEGLNGLPITNEWRTFWMQIDGQHCVPIGEPGFYWASHPELKDQAQFTTAMYDFTRQCVDLIVQNSAANFFVLDVAETAAGDTILIEINDGSMSGLGCVDADKFYRSLVTSPVKMSV